MLLGEVIQGWFFIFSPVVFWNCFAMVAVGLYPVWVGWALGLPLETLALEDERQNWYSAVFVE